jgi:hypothetical protein
MPSKQDLANRGLRLWQEWQVKPSPDRTETKPQYTAKVAENTENTPEKTKIFS